MSDGEQLLRGELEILFDPHDWYSDESGECVVSPGSVLNWVIERILEGKWLVTNGEIYRVIAAESSDIPGFGVTIWEVRTR